MCFVEAGQEQPFSCQVMPMSFASFSLDIPSMSELTGALPEFPDSLAHGCAPGGYLAPLTPVKRTGADE